MLKWEALFYAFYHQKKKKSLCSLTSEPGLEVLPGTRPARVLLKNICARVYAGGAQPEHRQMSCPLLRLHMRGACCRRPPTPECAEAVTGGDALSLPRWC